MKALFTEEQFLNLVHPFLSNLHLSASKMTNLSLKITVFNHGSIFRQTALQALELSC